MGAARILRAAAHFSGWDYARTTTENKIPQPRAPLPESLVWHPGDRRRVDCSTFAAALVVYAFPDLELDPAWYAAVQIMDAGRPWSAPDAWAAYRVGRAVEGLTAPRWGLYQGWADDKPADVDGDPISGGHQFFFHAGSALRLHASSRAGRVTMDRSVTVEDLKQAYPAGIRGVSLGD